MRQVLKVFNPVLTSRHKQDKTILLRMGWAAYDNEICKIGAGTFTAPVEGKRECKLLKQPSIDTVFYLIVT